MPNILTLENNILSLGKTAFFLCDMQEKFRPAIDHFKEIVEVSKRLVTASTILDIPLVVTEQVIFSCNIFLTLFLVEDCKNDSFFENF